MITGLKVWDRQGREISNLTGRYCKFVGSTVITEAERKRIYYDVPEGATRIVVPVYLGRVDEINQPEHVTEEKEEEEDAYSYTYELWQAKVRIYRTGFSYNTRGQDGKRQTPIKIYWGYI